MNIILLKNSDLVKSNLYKLTDKRAAHIRDILRAQKGDALEIGILNGPLGKAKIASLEKDEITLKIIKLYKQQEKKLETELICALPRPQTLKKVLSVSAAMGVSRIYFIKSNRVEKSFFHSTLLKNENYFGHILEGLSQGKRTKPPEIYFYKRFKKFFEDTFAQEKTNETKFALKLLAEGSFNNYLTDVLPKTVTNITLAIGPEGGWIPFEIKFMEKHGFIPFKISNSVLRVESAVTAALAQIELVSNFK